MDFKQLLCVGFAAITLGAIAQPKEAKVLFIGLDGTRSDALQQANTPTIDSLMAAGINTYDSWHMGVTVSGPSWSNMLTGVWEAKHKVTNNNYGGADYANWPYIPNRVKDFRPDLKAVQIITWNSMDDASKGTGGNVYNAEWDLSIDVGNQGQDLIMQASIIQLQDPDLDFLFAYIQDADGAGHGTGFSLTSPAYINAIENNDAQIKAIINALRARPTYANEEWLIVCSTDHGGLGTGHGGNSNQERHIWWFASAPFLHDSTLTGSDPGSFQMSTNPVDPLLAGQVPLQTDVAVTIIDHLLPNMNGDEIKTLWNLDGKSWLTPAYYDSTLYENQKGGLPNIGVAEFDDALQARIFPNPANGSEINFDVKNEKNKPVYFQLIDAAGNIVLTDVFADGTSFTVNVSEVKPGVYFVQLQVGKNASQQKLIIQ